MTVPNSLPGIGNPRLVFAYAGSLWTHEPQREFALVERVTTIGSGPDADLQLAGLEACHAEIHHDTDDDYTYVPLCAATSSSVHGRPGEATVLRSGTRIEFGAWTVSFQREEFADGTAPEDSPAGRRFAVTRGEVRDAQATDDNA